MTEFSERTDRQAGAELVAYLRILKDTIDFDSGVDISKYLTPNSKNKIDALEKVTNDVQRRQETLYRISCLEDRFDLSSLDGQFGIKQLRAVITWEEEIKKIRHTPFVQEIVEELGLDPQSFFVLTEVPEEVIESQTKRVEQAYDDCGYEFSRRGLQRYRKAYMFKIRDGGTEIKDAFSETRERLIPTMRSALGLDYIPSVNMEFVQEDKYYKVWVSGESGDYTMRINTHNRHEGKWDQGQVGRLVIHEYEHLFEIDELFRRVYNDELNPMHGITTVPGPYQWHAEAFADSITRFFPEIYDNMTVFERAAVQYEILKHEVLRNASLKANLRHEPRTQVRKYVHDRLPGDSHRDIKRYVDDRIDNIQYRAYFLSYGGVKEMCDYAAILGSDPLSDKRAGFARSLFARQMSPTEVLNKFREFEDYTPSPTHIPFSRRLVSVSDAAYENFRRFIVGKQPNKPLYSSYGSRALTERTT